MVAKAANYLNVRSVTVRCDESIIVIIQLVK